MESEERTFQAEETAWAQGGRPERDVGLRDSLGWCPKSSTSVGAKR